MCSAHMPLATTRHGMLQKGKNDRAPGWLRYGGGEPGAVSGVAMPHT